MSTIKCKCGKFTNTAVCDWIDSDDDRAECCYIAFDDNNKWIKGCAYDKTPAYMLKTIDRLLQNEVKEES